MKIVLKCSELQMVKPGFGGCDAAGKAAAPGARIPYGMGTSLFPVQLPVDGVEITVEDDPSI